MEKQTLREFLLKKDLQAQRSMSEASRKAMVENTIKHYNETARIWDASFGLYCVICGAVQMSAESEMNNIIAKLRPSEAMMKEIKAEAKYNKAAIKRLTLERYPYYSQQTKQALNYLQEQGLEYYENWAKKQIKEELNIVSAIVDKGVEMLQKKIFILKMSVKQEMDLLRMEDSDLRSKVYTVHLLYRLAFQLHRMLVAIGPREEWVYIDEDTTDLGIISLARQYPNNGDSPTYDYDYLIRMRPACPRKPLEAIGIINNTINGNFEHKQDGNVDICLNGILASVTSVHFVSSMPYSEVLKEEGYGEELELINRLLPFRTGRISATLYHLMSVKLMLQGKEPEEIVPIVQQSFRHMSEEQVMQMLITTHLCKKIVEGKLDVDTFNQYMQEKIDEGLMPDNTLSLNDPKTIVEAVDIVAQGIEERKKVEAKKPKKKPQPQPEPKSEAERLADLLSEKFGKVSVQKQKQPKPKPTPKAEAKTEAPAEPVLTIQEPEPRRSHRNNVWSETDTNRLREMWGRPIAEIAASLNRTEASIRAKAYRLKLQPANNNSKQLF